MNLYSTELQPWPGQAPQDGDRPVPNSPSEDDHYLDDPIKYDLSVWLAELDDATDDVPQIPPAFIVYCRGKNSPTGDLGFLFVDLLNSPGCLGLPPNDFILDCPPHLCRAPRQG